MDRDTFIGILVGLEVGRRIPQKQLMDFYAEAGRRGINLVRYGLSGPPVTAAPESVAPSLTRRALGTLGRRSPYIVGGAALGEAVRRSPELVEDIIESFDTAQAGLGIPKEKRVKKKASKFNKAISAGMAAVKKSKSFGKPGQFSNSKKAFATVTKTVSGINKGKKRPTKGIRGQIARAVKGYI
jgi:hypothetical protein